jgi:N-acetylglucosaminyldiphosphoundecaprenol N-acetyl-beta-D-mannosaminyltransferase
MEECPTARAWAGLQRLSALGVLILLSPLLFVVWAAVRLTSPGPFLFRQERTGLNGQRFAIYKIRTMRADSEQSTALGVTRGSSRITPVGRLLRELKLDELPQLWNIVRGDMELVGPRPIPVALHEELAANIPGFNLRNHVRPGLSNVSQVAISDNALGDRLIEDWRMRLEGELHYIRNKSFAYDLLVVVMTVVYILRKLARPLLEKRAAVPATEFSTPGTTDVAGVAIANLDYAGAVDRIATWIEREESHYVGVCPVHSIVEAHWRESHRNALMGASINVPDGMPVVWAQRLFGFRAASRVYGPTLMIETLQRAEREGWRIALYGGHEDRLPVLEQRLLERFPRLNLVCSISPPFRTLTEEEDAATIAQLNEARPDIVWVGLGCPKQERWMADHVGRVQGVLIGVGAAFDFHAGAVRQAPALLQSLGLEWVFRLACEPRRLFKRYATTNPCYIWLITRQWCCNLIRRRVPVKADERRA